MNTEEILTKVQEICVKLLRLSPEKVTAESRLIEDLDMDSLFAAELGFLLEKEFKIDVPEEKIATFVTVADIVSYVEGHSNPTEA